jgi:hypothetical protein
MTGYAGGHGRKCVEFPGALAILILSFISFWIRGLTPAPDGRSRCQDAKLVHCIDFFTPTFGSWGLCVRHRDFIFPAYQYYLINSVNVLPNGAPATSERFGNAMLYHQVKAKP